MRLGFADATARRTLPELGHGLLSRAGQHPLLDHGDRGVIEAVAGFGEAHRVQVADLATLQRGQRRR
jgi:hypothetical protein